LIHGKRNLLRAASWMQHRSKENRHHSLGRKKF
jgi:hypothetical protein